ncbi:MAG: hypothetical protein ABSB19_11790 [Methylomonas sp.]|jgi:hypothetical protein
MFKKYLYLSGWVLLLFLGEKAQSETFKCSDHGKTLYTDDRKRCKTSDVKQDIANAVSPAPTNSKSAAASASRPTTTSSILPDLLKNLPLPAGISKEEIETGWKTIMDAQKRGAWKAPEIPDEDK